MPDIQLKSVSDVTEEEFAVWSRIQQSHREFESPYFRPEFTRHLSAVRDDVEVAVFHEHGKPIGFLPFQRGIDGLGVPVGGRLSDFHGVVIDPNVNWDACQLLRELGISAWNFDHLIAEQAAFHTHHFGITESPYADVSDGFEAYKKERRQSGSKRLKTLGRKKRNLERDVGPVRVEFRSTDPQLLELLLSWKSEQYRQSGLIDLFDVDWTRDLLHRILNADGDLFSGMMSVLYVGEDVAAIDFGMRSGGILHSWFPAYNLELARYCPGHLLLVELLQQAEELELQRIHFGKGEESYKTSFSNGHVLVAEGSVDLRAIRGGLKRGWFHTRRLIKQTPLRTMFKRPVRWAKRLLDSAAM